ncbi:hypothetical protein CYMTET_32310 [Cymbomonas tetramitiformis]|uniref:Uncharacterized protein n=1 Tax=Cymbomonas tetramitiformis TaxID=36881 RepID=A0AAE0FFB0_9CHLO|nr:hypothetical protein CYMTET_32310 [Cymbomonas tetramitiformis]
MPSAAFGQLLRERHPSNTSGLPPSELTRVFTRPFLRSSLVTSRANPRLLAVARRLDQGLPLRILVMRGGTAPRTCPPAAAPTSTTCAAQACGDAAGGALRSSSALNSTGPPPETAPCDYASRIVAWLQAAHPPNATSPVPSPKGLDAARRSEGNCGPAPSARHVVEVYELAGATIAHCAANVRRWLHPGADAEGAAEGEGASPPAETERNISSVAAAPAAWPHLVLLDYSENDALALVDGNQSAQGNRVNLARPRVARRGAGYLSALESTLRVLLTAQGAGAPAVIALQGLRLGVSSSLMMVPLRYYKVDVVSWHGALQVSPPPCPQPGALPRPLASRLDS